MWDITAGGAAGSGGASGQAEGPSGQQSTGVFDLTIEGPFFHNGLQRWLTNVFAEVPGQLDYFLPSAVEDEYALEFGWQEFTGSTPTGGSLTTGWTSFRNSRYSGFQAPRLPNPSAGQDGIIFRARHRRTITEPLPLVQFSPWRYVTRRYPPPPPTEPDEPPAPPPVVIRPSNLRVGWQESGNDIIVIPSATNGVTFRTRARFGSGSYSLPSPPNQGRFYQYSTGNRRYRKPSGATTITVELFARSSGGGGNRPRVFHHQLCGVDDHTVHAAGSYRAAACAHRACRSPAGIDETPEGGENPQTEGPGEVVQQLGGSDQPGINIELASQVFPVGAVNPDNWETVFIDIGTHHGTHVRQVHRDRTHVRWLQ